MVDLLAWDRVLINADAPYIKMVSEQFDRCHGTLLQYVEFLCSAFTPAAAYAQLIPSLDDLVHLYHLDPEVYELGALSSCCHFRDDSDGVILDLGPPQKPIVWAELLDTVKTMLPSKAWNNLSPDLYVTFWGITLYDLYVPRNRYESEIAKQHAALNALEELPDDSSSASDESIYERECGNMPGFAVFYRYPNSQRVTYGQFIKCGNDAPISASSMLCEASQIWRDYMMITYGDPSVRMPHLNQPAYNWNIKLHNLHVFACYILLNMWHHDVVTQLIVESTVLSADPIAQKSDGLEESADPSFDDVVQLALDFSGYKIVNWLSEETYVLPLLFVLSEGLLTTAMEYLKLLGSDELSPELVILKYTVLQFLQNLQIHIERRVSEMLETGAATSNVDSSVVPCGA
ncbi:hypothetical protein CCACVL1_10420 [Corchorus capsularis]|uniref:THO complex subunitTHOC2 C-terminal domain-containing protein n=1 Tax=Corchorus capsularis TaxID=210143 RepID=A0A1R3IRD1_COCAP|nr:hypothetical protein CCACVL1_10420 [Corchorus capsularis]